MQTPIFGFRSMIYLIESADVEIVNPTLDIELALHPIAFVDYDRKPTSTRVVSAPDQFTRADACIVHATDHTEFAPDRFKVPRDQANSAPLRCKSAPAGCDLAPDDVKQPLARIKSPQPEVKWATDRGNAAPDHK